MAWFRKPAALAASFGILVAFLLVLIAVRDEATQHADDTVAVIGNRTITSQEFAARMAHRGGGLAGQFSTTRQKMALLDEMINQELLVARARAAGYDQDPDILQALERLMVSKLRQTELNQRLSAVTVSDDEIVRYYQEHRDDYTTPAKSRIAIILFRLPGSASAEKRAETRRHAEDVRRQALSLDPTAQDFGPLAARYSADQSSRYVGGDIGWIADGTSGRFADAALASAVDRLVQAGEVGPVVEGKQGFYLVKLIDRREEKVTDVSEVHQQIHRALLKTKRVEAESAWLASLRDDEIQITINQSVLESVSVPNEVTPTGDSVRPPPLPSG